MAGHLLQRFLSTRGSIVEIRLDTHTTFGGYSTEVAPYESWPGFEGFSRIECDRTFHTAPQVEAFLKKWDKGIKPFDIADVTVFISRDEGNITVFMTDGKGNLEPIKASEVPVGAKLRYPADRFFGIAICWEAVHQEILVKKTEG
jgi:hypothetical protein